MSEIEPVGARQRSSELERLQEFEAALLLALDSVGLPSEGVLVEVEQRARVFENYPNALALLTGDQREQSMYLSKLLAAVGAGLFDAALNYLWDETIAELRRRVARYDLAYFFDIAVPSPDRRKDLHGEEHLDQISDQDLIRAAREIGLISDIGYQQLDLIRYMRNYASAAHPNQNEIYAYQLLGFDSARNKFGELLDAIVPRLTRPAARDLLDEMRTFTGEPHKIAKDSALRRSVERLQ